MIDVSFSDYLYFPTLRTRQAELKGLEMLDTERKRQILPVLTLGRWPRSTDFRRAAEKAQEVMGGLPYFLDLTTDARHLADQQRVLRSSTGAFDAWRSFVAEYANAVPVVQLSDGRVRDITRQAQEIERAAGRVAFRIRDFGTETPMVINAVSAIDQVTNAMVFIDCQYIRNAMSAYVTATVHTINQLRTEFPELIIAILSTSFPASTVPFADTTQQRGSIDIQERELHSRIGGAPVAAYGDHASIHSVVYDEAPIMRWAARIDYPRPLDWYFERRPSVQSPVGYSDAARSVVERDAEIGTRNIWGEDRIVQAANGDPHAAAPASWISVRVNIHLARQLDFSIRLSQQGDEDEETAGDAD